MDPKPTKKSFCCTPTKMHHVNKAFVWMKHLATLGKGYMLFFILGFSISDFKEVRSFSQNAELKILGWIGSG